MSSSTLNHIRFSDTNDKLQPAPILKGLTPRRESITTINNSFLEVVELAEKIKSISNLEDISNELENKFNEKSSIFIKNISNLQSRSNAIVRLVEKSIDAKDEVYMHIISLKLQRLSSPEISLSTIHDDKEYDIDIAGSKRIGVIEKLMKALNDKINLVEDSKNGIILYLDSTFEFHADDLETTIEALEEETADISDLFEELHEMIYTFCSMNYPCKNSELEFQNINYLVNVVFPNYYALKRKWQTVKVGKISLEHLKHDVYNGGLIIQENK